MNENIEIYDLFEKIKTRQDFEFFLKKLIIDFNDNKGDWENSTLESFLEGLYGYNYNSDNDKPTWKLFAEIILAARVYE